MRLVWVVIPLVLIGIVGIQESNASWIAKSPEDLLEKSHTIIVGNVTAVNILEITATTEIAGQFDSETDIPLDGPFSARLIKESGDSKIFEITYVSHINEMTIDIEEYLKNLSIFEYTTIDVLAPFVPGVPRLHHEVKSKFELGDRVLLYFTQPSLTNQYYSLESFVIPEQCVGSDVLTQDRFWMNESTHHIMQNGIEQSNNDHKFVANIPITFTQGKDMKTLFGKNFTVGIEITKWSDNSSPEIVFSKVIESKSKPCEWIAYTNFEFTPKGGGKYVVSGHIQEEKYSSSTSWIAKHIFVNYDEILLPLKQYKMGIPVDEIHCRESLIVMEKYNGSPACVKPSTVIKLQERGWGHS